MSTIGSSTSYANGVPYQVAATPTPTTACPLLEKLPVEIRLIIYQYLVVSNDVQHDFEVVRSQHYSSTYGQHDLEVVRSQHYSSTYGQHDLEVVRSQHYNGNYLLHDFEVVARQHYNDIRSWVLRGADYWYRFHLSIFGANKQIRAEAMDLFNSKNRFISLTYSKHEHCYDWTMGQELEACGVAIIARGGRAASFPNVAIKLHLNPGFEPRHRSRYRTFLFTIEHLPAACAFLQRKIFESRENGQSERLHVTASPQIQQGSLLPNGACSLLGSVRGKCLQTLQQIRNVGGVNFYGVEDHDYIANLISSMTGRRRSGKETMDLVGAHFDLGDQHLAAGSQREAISEYKAALRSLRGGYFEPGNLDEEVVGGRFDGLLASQARDDADVQLHTQTARAFLQLGKHRMARIYVERIYGPLYSLDDRANILKFPLNITTNNHVVYAELLSVAAYISLATGNTRLIIDELRQASVLDPQDREISRRLEECEKVYYARSDRRRAKQAAQDRSTDRKTLTAVQVAQGRKVRADKAYREGNFLLARKLYRASYSKIQYLRVCDYDLHQELETCKVETLTQLLKVNLELHDYKAINHWAKEIFLLETENNFWYHCKTGEAHKVAYVIEAFHMVYYAKAMRFQSRGNIGEAIDNLENALVCDGGCHATYYQLQLLRERKPVSGEGTSIARRMSIERLEFEPASHLNRNQDVMW